MYSPLFVHIKGVLPTMQHNGRLKNPLDVYAEEISAIAAQTKKTTTDHIRMLECEFKGGLYLHPESKNGGPVVWPAANVHACFRSGARKKRRGKDWDSAVIVEHPCKFIYEGPQTMNSLWANKDYQHVIGTGRGTMCCRSIYPAGWEVKANLRYIKDMLDLSDIKEFIVWAGKYIGLSDWPRRFGLFQVLEFREEHVDAWSTKSSVSSAK